MQRNKALGQTFTDAGIVKFMLDEIAYSSKGKIIDSSCGNGAFLVEIAKRIIDNQEEKSNLYGWDVDSAVVKECLESLNQMAIYDWQVKTVQDSLLEALEEKQSASMFQPTNNIFKNNYLAGFDYVIGNPPYISYNESSSRGTLFFQFIKEGKVKLNDVYGVNLHSVPENPKKYAPKPNLYAFSVALGLGLLKDGGKLSFIIPQTVLTEPDYDVLSYHLANFCTIEKIVIFKSLEQVKFSDLVDFSDVLVQKFDSIEIADDFLLLKSGDKISKCKISKDKNLVAQFIKENTGNITLKSLKNVVLIDKNRQTQLKKKIDDLVFCLYFNVQLVDLEKISIINIYKIKYRKISLLSISPQIIEDKHKRKSDTE